MHHSIVEICKIICIAVKPFGLVERPAVPAQSEPFHCIKNNVYSFLGGPLEVGIFYSQHHLTTHFAGVEPVKQSGTGTTYMKITRWAGGESGNNMHFA